MASPQAAAAAPAAAALISRITSYYYIGRWLRVGAAESDKKVAILTVVINLSNFFPIKLARNLSIFVTICWKAMKKKSQRLSRNSFSKIHLLF